MDAKASNRRVVTATLDDPYWRIWLKAASITSGNLRGVRDDPQPAMLVAAIGRRHNSLGQSPQRGSQAIDAVDCRKGVVDSRRQSPYRDLDQFLHGALDVLTRRAANPDQDGVVQPAPQSFRQVLVDCIRTRQPIVRQRRIACDKAAGPKSQPVGSAGFPWPNAAGCRPQPPGRNPRLSKEWSREAAPIPPPCRGPGPLRSRPSPAAWPIFSGNSRTIASSRSQATAATTSVPGSRWPRDG